MVGTSRLSAGFKCGWVVERTDQARPHSVLCCISIETPVEDVDIWTPVGVEVGLPVTIET